LKENFLFISDVHEPYSHPRAIEFCKSLQVDFDIHPSNVYSVGDILDLYGFSRWPKSPDAPHTINQEIELCRERIAKWVEAFPEMKIAHSNHDMRVMRKAIAADLPSQVIKSVEEIFQFPKEWELKEQFVVMADKCEFLVSHGEEFPTAIQAAIHYGINVVEGHKHVKAGVEYSRSRMCELWGLSVGCLVDRAAHAFDYGDKSRKKPIVGCGVLLNGIPHFIPLK
jgi:predicted phosphodiesterase